MTWQRWLATVAGVLVLCGASFGAGRWLTPPRVETREVVRVETVTVEVEKRVEVAAKERVVYVDRVVTKEGAVTERIEYRDRERTTKEIAAARAGSAATERQSEARREADPVLTPRVTVLALVGADLAPAWQPIPGAGPLTLGAAVNLRVAGPITVGFWGLHTGVFGASVGGQF